jgi:hypothetical protein
MSSTTCFQKLNKKWIYERAHYYYSHCFYFNDSLRSMNPIADEIKFKRSNRANEIAVRDYMKQLEWRYE